MNKQQLAAKFGNPLIRCVQKIEASMNMHHILGFMFYKLLQERG